MKFPSVSALLSYLAATGYHLVNVETFSTDFGSAGRSLGIDAQYVRIEDGTKRATCAVRVMLRRYSYGLHRMLDVEEVSAEFASYYGDAIHTAATRYPAAGPTLGAVVAA